jgi:pantoate--beta-alanine ligase
MQLVRTRAEVREWVAQARRAGERVALVPTMGYLHAGHLSLAEIGRRSASRVALSIFVNPLQFGPTEDLDRYPRDLDRDLGLAESAGVDLVFAPPVAEMYPGGEPWVAVIPERGADRLDGASRPGHFRGVLTVVAKLFGIFTPDVAVFGQKDYQQLTLIRRMVSDLDIPVAVEGGPTLREPDGLAMSSRNAYLSPEERERARALSAALEACRALFAAGEREVGAYLRALSAVDGPGVELDYAEVVDPATLEPATEARAGVVCALAARVGKTRLIDNAILGA